MKKLALLVSVFLFGCSTYGPEKIAELKQLVDSGDCAGAARVANTISGSTKFDVLGVLAEVCESDRAKAINYYRYAASLGDQHAVGNLLRLGEAVPDKRASASNNADIASGILLLQAAQPKLTPMQTPININCQSRSAFGAVYTNCN